MTVLFCDVTGSTALGQSTDPEALRALLVHYFERMRGIIEFHGGTVEKPHPSWRSQWSSTSARIDPMAAE